MVSKIRLFFEPFTRGLFYLLFVVLLAIGGWLMDGGGIAFGIGAPEVGAWLMGGAAGLFLLRLITQLIVINLASYRMGQRMFGLSIIWYDICLPLISLYMLATQPMYDKREW